MYEVRCCCNANIIYGWMLVRENIHRGAKLYYPQRDIVLGQSTALEVHETITLIPECLGESVESYGAYEHFNHMALKYADDSLPTMVKFEKLKRLADFVPNPFWLETV